MHLGFSEMQIPLEICLWFINKCLRHHLVDLLRFDEFVDYET